MKSNEFILPIIKDIAKGVVFENFKKRNGRYPRYGEITNLKMGNIEIELDEDDFQIVGGEEDDTPVIVQRDRRA